MHRFILVVSCLARASSGLRAPASAKNWKRQTPLNAHRIPFTLQANQGQVESRVALVWLLVALEPSAAFNPSGSRGPLPAVDRSRGACRGLHRRNPLVSMKSVSAATDIEESRRRFATGLLSLLACPLIPQVAVADEMDDLFAAPPPPAPLPPPKPQFASAYFTAGDPRFIEPTFDDLKYNGYKRCEVGSLVMADGTKFPAVKVFYDSKQLTYKRLLGSFWRGIDPTDADQQFGVKGPSIVWVTDEEKADAEASRIKLGRAATIISGNAQMYLGGKPIKTEIRSLDGTWEKGPEADQGWYRKNEKAYQDAFAKTGRKKWFDDNYAPRQTRECRDGVCGFVYFPCSSENRCLDVLNGNF